MADYLIYSTSCSNAKAIRPGLIPYSNAKLVAKIRPEDRIWVIISGASLRRLERQAAFLVGIWEVGGVRDNPNDDPDFPKNEYRFKIEVEDHGSIIFDDPVLVDHLLRPEGRDLSIPIGRFVSVPRQLNEQLVRKLRAAAGPELALRWLTGTRR
jgi:hypothetical protein